MEYLKLQKNYKLCTIFKKCNMFINRAVDNSKKQKLFYELNQNMNYTSFRRFNSSRMILSVCNLTAISISLIASCLIISSSCLSKKSTTSLSTQIPTKNKNRYNNKEKTGCFSSQYEVKYNSENYKLMKEYYKPEKIK